LNLRTAFFFTTVAAMLSAASNAPAAAAWYNASWTNRIAITIDHTKVSSNLTNFPVLISLTNASLQASAQPNGNDLLFTSLDGTNKLSHEIESYTASNGSLVAWVNVPGLSASADTILYLYYGNSTTTNQENATRVWDSNFKAVWHLHDNYTALPTPLYQWTFDNGDGVPAITAGGGTLSVRNINGTGNIVFSSTNGVSQGVLDATANGYATSSAVALATNLTGLGTLNQFTLTFWVKQPATTNSLSRIVQFGASSGYDNGGKSSTLNNGFGVAFSFNRLQPGFGSTNKYFNNVGLNTYGSAIGTNVWTFVSLLYDGTSILASNSPAMATATGGVATNNMATYLGTLNNSVSFDAQTAITPNSISDSTNNLGPISFGNSACVLMGNLTNGANSRGLAAALDDVRIYNSMLNPAQLEAIRLAGVPNITDSTINAHDGTGTNMMSGDAQLAKLAGGMNFDGTANQCIQTTSGESKTASSLTWECWFKAGSTTYAHHLMAQGIAASDGWGNATSNEPAMNLSLGDFTGSNVNNRVSFFFGDTDSSRSVGIIDAAATFSDTTAWHHAAAVVTNISVSPGATLYIDGVAVASSTGTTARTLRSAWNTNLRLGAAPNGFKGLLGVLDEVRVSDTNRSAAWIGTGYNNQNSPATFYSLGSPETLPTKLAITSVNSGSNPTVGAPFSVVIQAQDNGGTARNVTTDTAVTLSLNTGSGILGGTLTGTISAGTNSATISSMTYTRAESGIVINANRTGGDSLTAGNSSSFTVNPATVTITSGLNANNKVYDGANPATISSNNVILSGVSAGDAANVKLSTNSYTATFASVTVGSGKVVTLSGLTLTGSAAGNYTLTQPGLSANITTKSLTVTGITANNKVYNSTTSATVNTNGAAPVGAVGADIVTLTGTAAGTFATTTVGAGKVVTVTGLTLVGADAANYTLIQPSLTANITAASLTATGVIASNKVYDGNTTATVSTNGSTLVGIAGADIVTLAGTAAGTFATKTVAVGKTITVSGLTLSGADSANYTLIQPSLTANITAASLTVTGVTASNKVYDGNTTATVSTNGSALAGIIGADVVTLTGTAAGTFANNTVATGKTVTLSGLAINGTDSGNYSLTQPTTTANITAASTLNALVSSLNPALPGSNITFTATISVVSPGGGTPTGNIIFKDGTTLLGTNALNGSAVAIFSTNALAHGSHTINAEYAGDGNFLGSTNSLSQVVNARPVAVGDVLPRNSNTGAKVRSATLLANDTDPDGDALTFISVSATNASGGTNVVLGNWISYKPPAGFTNADSFTYIVADSYGLQATGTVSVAILVDSAPAQNIGSIDNLGNSSSLIHFSEIPGRTYTIQYTTNLVTPVWQPLGTNTADAFGKINFTDSPATNSPARFYRSTSP
jgi:Bacterial Ig-like domain (group 3)/YDG domain/Concanavalin A-like lectin/glucanases superfamily/Domain of unknown function (DUF2341)